MTTAALSQIQYLRATREGRIALRVVWIGLVAMTGGFLAYAPMLRDMQRQGLVRHLWLQYVLLAVVAVLALARMVARG